MKSVSNVAIDVVTTVKGTQNLDLAHKKLGSLDTAVSKLGRTLAITFSATALAAFGNAAVTAFANDDKSAKILTQTLSNLGLAFNDVPVESFISKLSELNGIAKTDLRTSFDTLVRQTLDTTKAQDLLNLSLNVSKGTGKDLSTVTTAISKAYGGNFTALSKLGAGLTKADLASKNFELIQKKLAATFAGDAAVAANSYAGKIDRLKNSYEDFKISVGSGIVDAFSFATSSGGSIDKFQAGMASVATNIANTVRGVGVIIGYIDDANTKLAKTTGFSFTEAFKSFFGLSGLAIAKLQSIGKDAKATATRAASGTANSQFDKAIKDSAKLQAAQKKLATDKAAADKAALTAANATKKAVADKLALERAALSLKLAGSVADMQNIEIQAALQRGQTAQVNDVLLLQRALLNNNADQANILAQRVLIANGLVMDVNGNISALATAKDPFKDWPTTTQSAIDEVQRILDALAKIVDKTITVTVNTVNMGGGGGGAGTINSITGRPNTSPDIPTQGVDPALYADMQRRAAEAKALADALAAANNLPIDPALIAHLPSAASSTTPVNVTVVLDSTVVAGAVQQTIVNNTASGTPSTFARSQGVAAGGW